jgi:hypothetical protein
MSKRPDNGYQLSVSGLVRAEIRALGRKAVRQGRKDQFAEVLQRAWHRMRTDPFAFGELIRDVPRLDLVLHVGSVPPLTVRFGINEHERVVFVFKVYWNPS